MKKQDYGIGNSDLEWNGYIALSHSSIPELSTQS